MDRTLLSARLPSLYLTAAGHLAVWTTENPPVLERLPSSQCMMSTSGANTSYPPGQREDSNNQLDEKAMNNADTSSSSTLHLPSSTRDTLASLLHPNAFRQHRQLEESLHLVVTRSGVPSSVLVGETSLALASSNSWLGHLVGGDLLDRLFAKEHLGNFVVIRSTGEKTFETMPLYARIGMHLLFYGSLQVRLLRWNVIRHLLKSESIRQGSIYDSTNPDVVRAQIASFVETYSIELSELAKPDLLAYKTFNSFFSRKLLPSARPCASPDDPSIIVSAADCRVTVWPSWSSARKIWVKGRHFTIKNLLRNTDLAKAIGHKPALAIFRLAPQDYHRFHAPVSGNLQTIQHLPGEYYTVNPQAVNEKLDVLTGNTRSVLELRGEGPIVGEKNKVVPMAVVAIGALLVGSIGWDKGPGERVEKGDGLGYFQYGGSTIVCVFPAGVEWDADLLKSSGNGLETLVKAGERIGKFTTF